MTETGTLAGTTGRIVSYTVIYVPTPEFAGEAPYGLAVVETAGGERLLVRIPGASAQDLRVGASVVYDHDDQHGAVFQLAAS